jgi:WD40 repeat protein/tRNA A-37 threonylcarbamoyl transferase component Bud32
MNSTGPSDRDQQVNEIIAAYLEAETQGTSPDRAEWAARHPEFAQELEAFFRDHDAVRRMADPTGAPIPPEPNDLAAAPTLGPTDRPPLSPRPAALTKIRYFGDYEILEEIARGGMGVVYKARQLSLNRIVALKMILAGQLASPKEVDRFYREAEAAANLDHPNLVPIYEVGAHDGQHYFSMKFIDGQSLASALASGVASAPRVGRAGVRNRQDQRAAAQIVAIVARAVHHAHQRGILHRDLKPGNVLLDAKGQPHVTDFGLAKRVETQSAETRTGGIIGTPSYMSPEQARSEKALSTAVDVYGLGAILYELLTGRPPFRAETPLDTVLLVLDREPEPPREVNPTIDPDLETVCLKCLEKDSGKRYGSAESLADELDRWLAGEPIQARPVGRLERAVRWCRRNPVVAGLTSAVILAVIAGSVVSFGFAVAESRRAAESQAAKLQADESADDARKAQTDARKAQDEATQEARQTRLERDRARRLLYGSRMKLAQRYWEDAQLSRVFDLLQLYQTAEDGQEFRGWEWYFLSRQRQGDLRHFSAATSTYLTCAAFSPAGRLVAAGSASGEVFVWDMATSKELLNDHSGAKPIYDLCFNKDGTRLAASGNPVRVWELSRKTEFLPGRWGDAESVAFSPDGRNLAIAFRIGVTIRDATTSEKVSVLRHNDLRKVRYSPDGQWLASGGRTEPCLKIWDAKTGKPTISVVKEKGPVRMLAFTADSRHIVTGSEKGKRNIWDVVHGDLVSTVQLGRISEVDVHDRLTAAKGRAFFEPPVPNGIDMLGYSEAAVSPDERYIVSTNGKNLRLSDTDKESGKTSLIGHEGEVYSLSFNHDGTQLTSGGTNGVLQMWNTGTGQTEKKLSIANDQVRRLRFSSDGKQLVAIGLDGSITTLAVQEGKVITRQDRFEGERLGFPLSVSPDLSRVAGLTGLGSSTIRLWDGTSRKGLLTLESHQEGIQAITFSRDGSRLATGGGAADNTIKVWDCFSGAQLCSLSGHTELVLNLAFDQSGQFLASGGSDSLVNVWDLSAGRRRHILLGHTGIIHGLSFSPDGKRLASSSSDRTVKLWDLESGQETFSLGIESGNFADVEFSPDGLTLAASGAASGGNGFVTLFDARPLTPELQIHNEALGWLRLLFGRPLPRETVEKRLRECAAMPEGVRQKALALMSSMVSESDPTRYAAASRWTSRRRGLPTWAYEDALVQAQTASKIAPMNTSFLAALGMAYYRVNQLAQAEDALSKAESARARDPESLVFLLMTHQRLGNRDKAQQYFRELKSLQAFESWAKGEEGRALLAEAEKVVGRKND